jgi:uncharacterized SAM-binding protein YcdF (DUF218 family)
MVRNWLGKWIRRLCMGLGLVALLMAVLAFTSIPFRAHRWLGTAGGLCDQVPEMIILLGGSGMPSGPELMRCNKAAQWAVRYPASRVLMVLPVDTGLADAMVKELGIKGVAPSRVDLLMHGRNTREQALDVAAAFPGSLDRPTAVVTAPENMYRTLLTFRKLGFTDIAGAPAFDHALFDDLAYGYRGIGGKPYVPDVSGSMSLRYDFWNRMKLEITCLREYAALAYYKLNGWI